MKELTLRATAENVAAVTAFVEAELEALGCPMKAQMQLDVAIDELFSNIARYAYAPGEGDATVRFDFDAAARTVSLTFIDRGVPFDPVGAAAPDLSLPGEDRPVGGLGIHLVKKTMDALEYRRDGGRNVLTLRKRI